MVPLTIICVLAYGAACWKMGYDSGANAQKALARKRDINLPIAHCQ